MVGRAYHIVSRSIWPTAAIVLIAAVMTGGLYCTASFAGGTQAGVIRPHGGSGLPVPRFVSLKTDRVNIRGGPGTDYKILWVFRRAGLPVEVIKEYQGWRQIRDADGSTGWVYGAMLSGRRTALVLPWEQSRGTRAIARLYRSDSLSSTVLAELEPGVLASVLNCSGQWCEISINTIRGYVEQKHLWGIYPNERVR